jgi:hypothetical protein
MPGTRKVAHTEELVIFLDKGSLPICHSHQQHKVDHGEQKREQQDAACLVNVDVSNQPNQDTSDADRYSEPQGLAKEALRAQTTDPAKASKRPPTVAAKLAKGNISCAAEPFNVSGMLSICV